MKNKSKKQTEPETILTGITEPTPDNKPDLKSIDIRSELFFVKNISDCVKLLLTELPYWALNETKYPDDAAVVEESVYYYLRALSYKGTAMLPPVPRGLNLLMGWVLFVYIYLAEQSEHEPLLYQLSPESHAIGLCRDDPGLNDETIAEIIGCSKSTIYNMPILKRAREIFGQAESLSRKHASHNPLRNPETGEVEYNITTGLPESLSR
ncbi:MAG: hypothetical protein ABIL62_05145 [Planctomycetota bacterium]